MTNTFTNYTKKEILEVKEKLKQSLAEVEIKINKENVIKKITSSVNMKAEKVAKIKDYLEIYNFDKKKFNAPNVMYQEGNLTVSITAELESKGNKKSVFSSKVYKIVPPSKVIRKELLVVTNEGLYCLFVDELLEDILFTINNMILEENQELFQEPLDETFNSEKIEKILSLMCNETANYLSYDNTYVNVVNYPYLDNRLQIIGKVKITTSTKVIRITVAETSKNYKINLKINKIEDNQEKTILLQQLEKSLSLDSEEIMELNEELYLLLDIADSL